MPCWANLGGMVALAVVAGVSAGVSRDAAALAQGADVA